MISEFFQESPRKQIIGLFLGPIFFILIFFFTSPAGMSEQALAILASTFWIAIWWITEAIPIAATALIPIVLFPVTGGLDISKTTAAFGNPMIFLFIGGFILAVAIERWGLHKRIAMNIIHLMGTRSSSILLGFMIATALLSMWISNTATTIMMMPIALAIITSVTAQAKESKNSQLPIFGKALMLSIAYAASIGGMATLIGTPTNVIFSGIVKQLYNFDVTFYQWIVFALPLTILLLFITWFYLVRIAFPLRYSHIPGGQEEIKKELRSLGKMSHEEKTVSIVFLITALAWIFRSFLLVKIIPGINDTIIAMSGAIVLFILPSKATPGSRILDWESAVKLPWGIIMLFGGGLALASAFKVSGLAVWIGDKMNLLQGAGFFLLLLVIIASVNFLTEITSNVATASMILPILAVLAKVLDIHPFSLMIAATLAASCAFMLPVATPPNAVVFASGELSMQDMVKAGFWMNIISIAIVSVYVYFILPLIWNFDWQVFPHIFK